MDQERQINNITKHVCVVNILYVCVVVHVLLCMCCCVCCCVCVVYVLMCMCWCVCVDVYVLLCMCYCVCVIVYVLLRMCYCVCVVVYELLCSFSSAHTLSCGVPQGSVLGARMYTINVAPLPNVINKHSINYHCYADDTQIYIQSANTTTAVQEAITRIQDCITDVSNWMSRHALKINENKTEFIIFSAKHYTYDRMSIQIGTNTIQHNNNVKILGVTLDAHMKLEKQISNTCRTGYMQIRIISSIRRYLTVYVVKTLVQATVTVRLDYCNSIYTNLPM